MVLLSQINKSQNEEPKEVIMNVNVIIDRISDETMFDEMIRELGHLINKNSTLEKTRIHQKRDGRTTSPIQYLDMSEYCESEEGDGVEN